MRDGIVRRQTSRFPKDRRVSLAVAVIGTAIWILLRLPAGAQAPEQAVLEQPDRLQALIAALENDLPYLPGELLVRFNPGVSATQQESVLRLLGPTVSRDRGRLLGDMLYFTGLEIDDPERASATLSRQPEVMYAHPNYRQVLHATPNDPLFSQQWNLATINMPQAWDINTSAASGVVVAVIDSGITTTQGTYSFRLWNGQRFAIYPIPFARTADFDHARVRPGIEVTPWGPWRTASGQPLFWDAGGHGTHVAGTIVQQTNNAVGYAGVAHGVTLMPIKACWNFWDVWMVLGATGFLVTSSPSGCDTLGAVAGIRYAADNGAKVINLSLGGPYPTPAYLDAIRYAVQRGAFVALSAGNSALEGNPVIYPAAYAPQVDGAVAVGAVTRTLQRARYSSFGVYVELAAPGGAGEAPVDAIWQVFPNEDDLGVLPPRFDRYIGHGIDGTSMASPHVAAVAALLYSQGITSPAAIEAALKQSSRDLGPPGRDNEYGFGVIDARAALRGVGVAR